MHCVLVAPRLSASIITPTCVFMSLKHCTELLNHPFYNGDKAQFVKTGEITRTKISL